MRSGCTNSSALAFALAVTVWASPHAGSPASNQSAGGGVLYVSNETAGTVVILDGSTGAVEAQVPVGKRPRGVKLSRDGSRLFVALSGSPIGGPGVDESTLPPADRTADGIGVIDLATGTVIRKYQSGSDPESFAISSDGRQLFVSNEDSGEMTALDLDSGAIKAHVKVGEE